MHIERIRIENFRNLRSVDVRVGKTIVVVGENKSGKSNLLHALRLLLDPSMPDTARILRIDDFSDSLPRPLKPTDRILVSVDLAGFENNNAQLALLADHLVAADPMVARLTYVFAVRPGAPPVPSEADYEFQVFGGDREDNRVSFELRRRAPLDVIHALRDAESDLANWRRSPLRPLLANAAAALDQDLKADLAKGVDEATSRITQVTEIAALQNTISATLDVLAGKAQTTDVSLGFAPAEADKLFRALRVFVDGGVRSIGEASLGVANTLYLALKMLEIHQLVRAGERDHTSLAIEEPEAHLYTLLQRNVYRAFLHPRAHQVQGMPLWASLANESSILLTTHSPHIASVTPLKSFVLLRRDSKGESQARSTAELPIDERDIRDLERYLDVTRGELLFARSVILVEGDAEEFLLPVLARHASLWLDAEGISVCAIGGTHFLPYVRLLAHLQVPFVVLTDGDPNRLGVSAGDARTRSLLAVLDPQLNTSAHDSTTLRDAAKLRGIFVGEHTLEVDLVRSGWHEVFFKALAETTTNGAAKTRTNTWLANPSTLDAAQFLADIKDIGKGRFAQRVATEIDALAAPVPAMPDYLATALAAIASRTH